MPAKITGYMVYRFRNDRYLVKKRPLGLSCYYSSTSMLWATLSYINTNWYDSSGRTIASPLSQTFWRVRGNASMHSQWMSTSGHGNYVYKMAENLSCILRVQLHTPFFSHPWAHHWLQSSLLYSPQSRSSIHETVVICCSILLCFWRNISNGRWRTHFLIEQFGVHRDDIRPTAWRHST